MPPASPKPKPKPRRKPAPKAKAGARHRVLMGRRSRDESAGVKEIGPLPKVVDRARRDRCRTDLRLFLTTYLPGRFPLPFCPDHDKVIAKLERCALRGGQLAIAMPRGSGKTTIVEGAIVWALLYGHRRYIVALAATCDLADDLVTSVKAEVETNDLLAADFPEACHPVRELEGIAQRGKGQTLDGRRTRLEWGAGSFRLAVVPGAACSGGMVTGRGLDSAIRGRKRPGPGGEQLRPDMVVADDPQTDESALSVGQTRLRRRLLDGAVLGLGGPGKTIAAVMPCTVIAPGDLSDQVLDHDLSPEWNGERTRLVYRFPADTAWWDRYAEVLRLSLRKYGDGRLANALYRRDRARADAGAEVAWPERYDAAMCESAVQEAMNFKILRPEAFWAEAQNDPLSLNPEADALALDAGQVAERLTGVPRGVVPRGAVRLTAFVDVSDSVLWYAVVGWDAGFGGGVVDYGCWPKQNRTYFRQADARPSLRDVFPHLPVEAAVHAGLAALAGEVLGRDWRTEGGGVVRVDRCLVDSGDQTEPVYGFCRSSPFAATLTPSKGFGYSPGRPGVRDWARRPDEERGRDWVLGAAESGRGKLLKFDANEWKTFTAQRLRTAPAAPGCLRLFGAAAFTHQLVADHCAAELPVANTSKGRTVQVWQRKPGAENHLWDCLVGCAVAASVAGLAWSSAAAAGDPPPAPAARERVSLRELRARVVADKARARRADAAAARGALPC